MEGEAVFTGIITPADWDMEGNVIAFNLSTYNEEEYRLEGTLSLLQIVHKQVKLTGIKKEKAGRTVLAINAVEVLG